MRLENGFQTGEDDRFANRAYWYWTRSLETLSA